MDKIKKKKKISAVIVSLMMILSLVLAFSVMAEAGTEVTDELKSNHNQSGNDKFWYAGDGTSEVFAYVDKNNTSKLCIVGAGTMKNYSSSVTPEWKSHNITSVEIANTVTSIGDYAFAGINISTISIPASVTAIGASAFSDCTNLTTVTFTETSTVASIGNSAFSGCEKITSVTIPSTVTTIGNNAFKDCKELSNISMEGTTATTLGTNVFENCLKLANITLPSGVTSISDSMFKGCSALTTVEVQGQVTSIGNNAFYGCSSLETFKLPILSANISIGDSAFNGCTKLTGFKVNETGTTIPDKVNTIGTSAFAGTGFTSVVIPDSVTSIGADAFKNCANLNTITAKSGVASRTVDTTAFSGGKNKTLILNPDSNSIKDNKFNNCQTITAIQFGTGTTSIGTTSDTTGVFEGNTVITSVTLPSGLDTIGKNAFKGCNNNSFTSITIPASVTSIGESAFQDCSKLGTVTFNDTSSLTTIGVNAFKNTKLTSVSIPNKVTTINSGAFSNCSSLANIYVSTDSEASINNSGFATDIFSNCSSSLAVTIKKNSSNSVTKNVFGLVSNINKVIIESGTTSISDNAFKDGTAVKNVQVPATVTIIGKNAFDGCTALESMDFVSTSTLNTIDESAFNGCTKLIMSIPGTVTTIGKGAFQNCDALTTIEIPSGVTIINENTFNGCEKLSNVTINGNITNINESAFSGCVKLATINFKRALTALGSKAFENCTALTSITLPSTLTSIASDTFSGCSKLKTLKIKSTTSDKDVNCDFSNALNVIENIIFNEGITEISDIGAFDSCSSIKSVTMPKTLKKIDKDSFKSCNNLNNVTFTDTSTLETIGESAFESCTALKSISLPGSLVTIETNAFKTSGLESISIPASVKTIGDSAFSGCTALATVTINGIDKQKSSKLTSIGEGAFSGCSALTGLVIPATCQTIGGTTGAFSGCDALPNGLVAYDSNNTLITDVKYVTIRGFVDDDTINFYVPADKVQDYKYEVNSVPTKEGKSVIPKGTGMEYDYADETERSIVLYFENVDNPNTCNYDFDDQKLYYPVNKASSIIYKKIYKNLDKGAEADTECVDLADNEGAATSLSFKYAINKADNGVSCDGDLEFYLENEVFKQSDYTFTADSKTESHNACVYDLNLNVLTNKVTGHGESQYTDGTKLINFIGDTALTIKIPFEPPLGKTTDDFTVFSYDKYVSAYNGTVLKDNYEFGDRTPVEGAYYDAANKCFVFNAKHFSYYGVDLKSTPQYLICGKAHLEPDVDENRAVIDQFYESVAEAVDKVNDGDRIKLLGNVKENVLFPSYKGLVLDLNGYKFDGNLTVDGELLIRDESTTYDSDKTIINMGTGEVTGNIIKRNGKVLIESGTFNKEQDLEDYLKDDTTLYYLDEKWVALPAGSNLQFDLSYKIFEEDPTVTTGENIGLKEITSNDGDDIPDLYPGKEYVAKIYFNTYSQGTTLRYFDFTALYDSSKMSVQLKVDSNSKYSIVHKGDGKLRYILTNNSYEINNTKEVAFSSFKFEINPEKVTAGEEIKFDFGSISDGYEAYVSTMDSIKKIPVNVRNSYKAEVSNKLDGVNVLDYRYAPEGYGLAIISAEHVKGQTLIYKNHEVFFTDNEAYISQSTNPEGKTINGNKNNVRGVYLTFVKLKLDGSGNPDYLATAEDVLKNIVLGAGNDNILSPEDYTGDIDKNGNVEYNDASLVYQMLKQGGDIWDYNNESSNKNLDSKSRFISEGNRDGKLYGTIEDVNSIIDKIQ